MGYTPALNLTASLAMKIGRIVSFSRLPTINVQGFLLFVSGRVVSGYFWGFI